MAANLNLAVRQLTAFDVTLWGTVNRLPACQDADSPPQAGMASALKWAAALDHTWCTA